VIAQPPLPPSTRISLADLALPILASLYFPLVAAASVPGELLRLADLFWPISITLGVAAATWLLGFTATRNRTKAALAAAAAVVAFSSLGWVVESLESVLIEKAIDPTVPVLVLYAVALCGGAVALAATRRTLTGLVHYLAVFAGLLVAWNALLVSEAATQSGRQPPPPVRADIAAPQITRDSAPDIYLIILDKYTSSAVLASQFGFDNHAVEAALEARGFVVPRQARSNYVHTFLTLASMLNLRYLDDLTARFWPYEPWEAAYPLIENNRLVSFLHSQGYRFVFFPTAFGGTRQNRYADVQLPVARDVRPEVQAAWAHTTALPVVRRVVCYVVGCDGDAPPYLPDSVDLMDWRFRTLASLPAAHTRPVFVLAHLLVPHEPYIYTQDCHHRPPYWPKRDDGAQAVRVRQEYLDQIRCINTKLLQAIDSIQARSPMPPVILLQADHGHGRLGRDLPGLEGARPQVIAERTSVFAAYALPGIPADSVPQTISPVNATRLVLRSYFGAALPPLPEQTFWSSTFHPYQFTRVDP
jgi:hypothetical protein